MSVVRAEPVSDRPQALSQVQETYIAKGWRKCREQPVVPIGVVLTCAAFLGATRSLRAGNKADFNRFLRFRVIAQGITIVGCVVGAWYVGREARVAKMEEQVLGAQRGQVTKSKAYHEGLGERMLEAERLHDMEKGVERSPPAPKP